MNILLTTTYVSTKFINAYVSSFETRSPHNKNVLLITFIHLLKRRIILQFCFLKRNHLTPHDIFGTKNNNNSQCYQYYSSSIDRDTVVVFNIKFKLEILN